MAGAIWAFYSCSQGGMEDLRGHRVTMSQLDFRKLRLNVVGDCLPELQGHLRSNVLLDARARQPILNFTPHSRVSGFHGE